VRVSGKNITVGGSLPSERGLSERRTSGQEMEVNTMAEGEVNDKAGKEVVTEGMDYTKVKNKFIDPKKRVAGETEEELMAQFSIVRSRKNQKNLQTMV
jgi:hypothetical protein